MDPKDIDQTIDIAIDNAAKMVESVKEARDYSAKMKPSMLWETMKRTGEPHPDPTAVEYSNKVYRAVLRRYKEGWPLGGGKWAMIGINSHDHTARHDWRDFQRIKNDLLGPDWEGVELYPGEGRLMDPSNFYMIWCAPRIKIGMNKGRQIADENSCIAPQRPFGR